MRTGIARSRAFFRRPLEPADFLIKEKFNLIPRFLNMLERFEEFARVRSATLRPAAWFSSLETNDLRPRPRRAWGSPQWPRPPDILDTNNYSLSNPGVRRASEYSPETGRRRSS